jgi:hypothetical protein
MLQLFDLSVAKLDLNVGLFSEEERASMGAMAASAVSWRQRSTGGRASVRAGVRGPFLYDMLPPLAPHRGPGAEACGISPCDRDADPGYGGDVGAMRLRPPVGTVNGQAPLLRGHGGRSVMRGMGQGAAELHPDAGLGPDVWVLVISHIYS